MRKVIYPLIPESWQKELEYFTKNEFSTRISKGRRDFWYVSSDEVNKLYNDANITRIDGEIIRGCDHLSAYLEACGVDKIRNTV